MADFDSIKQMPYSLEAEQAVLGGILVDSEKMNEIAELIKSEDFYLDQHKAIYTAMQEMFMQSRRIDFVTLLDTLERKGMYSKKDGAQYIKMLADTVPSIANIREYANIVRDNSLLRALINGAKEIADSAFSAQGNVSEIVDSAEQKIFSIAQNKYHGDFTHIRDVIVENYNLMQKMIDDPEGSTGTKTGFEAIDRMLIGMGSGDLVLVGARPGVGKTSFALNIAENVARKTKKAVAIFSLEMSKSQLVSRMLSSATMIDNYKLRTGNLTTEDWATLAKAASSLSKCDILIDDSAGITVTGMKAKLRRVKNLGFVVIDYLQLMQSDRRTENRVQEVSDISRHLKLLAKDLGVPVLTCAQLSRAPETRGAGGKKPMLSDLRDSGAIEQDADIIMFLYRDYYGDDAEKQNIAELIISKNRHGATGKIDLGWYGQFFKFISIEQKYDDTGN
ncbi:MAG: replicative DNA helicase [Clostridiales bacterium GWF2_38_85]|nr:MAG: replicative DNA helicase [Clostridiales bacterium GWF2_38_85]HBL84102.1 replicative DNA helicase [Clostridiales bacterium]